MELNQISATQKNKVPSINENFRSGSAAASFGVRESANAGLVVGWYGGLIYVDGVPTPIANGTTTLTASQTNYVERTRAGAVSANTSGFTAGRVPMFRVACTASAVDMSTFVDYRDLSIETSRARAAITVTTADVTLSADQARAHEIRATGTLTGNRAVIVPAVAWCWLIDNATGGAFTLTVKTAAGSGVVVPQGTVALVYCDGADVKTLSGIAGSLTIGGDLLGTSTTQNVFNTVATTVNAFSAATALRIGADGGSVAIGAGTTNRTQFRLGGTYTSGGASSAAEAINIGTALVGHANDITYLALLANPSSSITTANGVTVGVVAALRLAPPTVSVGGGGTVTETATLYITGAPSNGTSNYAVHVANGHARFDSTIALGGSVVSSVTGGITFNNNANNENAITVASIYASSTGGTIWPFTEAGHLVLEPRSSGASRNVAIVSPTGAVLTMVSTDLSITGADELLGKVEFRSSDNSGGNPIVYSSIRAVSQTAFDGSGSNGAYLSLRTGTVSTPDVERIRIDKDGNVGIGTATFGTSAAGVLGILNAATVPGSSPANMIQIYSKDSSVGATNATLGLRTEQAVEAIGTFTASHKLRVWINEVEYHIQLDQV